MPYDGPLSVLPWHFDPVRLIDGANGLVLLLACDLAMVARPYRSLPGGKSWIVLDSSCPQTSQMTSVCQIWCRLLHPASQQQLKLQRMVQPAKRRHLHHRGAASACTGWMSALQSCSTTRMSDQATEQVSSSVLARFD